MTDKNGSIASPTENGNFIEPAPMRWTLRLIFILVFVVGIIGNSVVCMAVIRRKRMRTSNNIFTFNLAFSDLLNVVIYLPTQMAAFENDQNWALGNFMCHFTYILVPLCLSASIGTLVAITCDRYRAIAYPMKPRLSKKKVKIILAIIWTISSAICCPLAFVAGEVNPEPGKVYCDETWPREIYSKIYWNFIFVIQYFLPLAMIAVLAVLIAVKIRQNSAIELLPKSSQIVAAAVRQRMRQTAKITNMLIALVILYAICMLPQHVVFLWWTYGDLGSSKYRLYVLRFSNVFPMANSAFNPIAYGTLNKEFKAVFKNFFKCNCRKADLDDAVAETVVQRNGKFRSAVYKHKDGEIPFSHNERWRRKSSVASLLSQVSTARNRARREKKHSKQGNNVSESIPNGHVTNTTIARSLSGSDAQRNGRELDLESQRLIKENLERKTLPTDLPPRHDGQKSVNGGPKNVWKAVDEKTLSSSSNLGELESEKGVNMGKEDFRSHCREDTNSGKDYDSNEMLSDEDLELKLLTFKDEKSSFVDSWLDSNSNRIKNRLDENMLRYIRTLKETDL